jgi:hypothetical protein
MIDLIRSGVIDQIDELLTVREVAVMQIQLGRRIMS